MYYQIFLIKILPIICSYEHRFLSFFSVILLFTQQKKGKILWKPYHIYSIEHWTLYKLELRVTFKIPYKYCCARNNIKTPPPVLLLFGHIVSTISWTDLEKFLKEWNPVILTLHHIFPLLYPLLYYPFIFPMN